jgi:hypothetical protein
MPDIVTESKLASPIARIILTNKTQCIIIAKNIPFARFISGVLQIYASNELCKGIDNYLIEYNDLQTIVTGDVSTALNRLKTQGHLSDKAYIDCINGVALMVRYTVTDQKPEPSPDSVTRRRSHP